MAIVIPFAALRPPRDKVQLVATRSYLTYDHTALRDKLDNNPYTFLHVIHPDPAEGPVTLGEERYLKVRAQFEQFVREGVFVEDPEPCYYLYRQQKDGHSHMGLLAAVGIQDYLDGKVKVHEHTLTAREQMFRDYLDTTGFNAEPVLLSHPEIAGLVELYQELSSNRAEYEFTSTDRALHLLWTVREPDNIEAIRAMFDACPALYIADGHHRTASSALLSSARPHSRAAGHFMALILPESQMRVSGFARLIRQSYRDLPSVLHILSDVFEIESIGSFLEPSQGSFTLYGSGRFFSLRFKRFPSELRGVEVLDPSLLSRFVLEPILGVHDPRTDHRLTFIPELDGGRSMVRAVDSGDWEFAVAHAPLQMSHVRAVSDAGEILPPKSTYIEPKLRSGMIIYRLDREDVLGR